MTTSAFETVDILHAETDRGTGAVVVQTGDVLSGEVAESRCVVYQQWGYLSLPAPPDTVSGNAAEGFTWKGTNADVLLAGRSVRSAAIAGLAKSGETFVFADGSQASSMWKLDGSIVHYTTHDNTSNGQAIYERIGPHGFNWEMPWGRASMGDMGFHFFANGGSRLDFGTISGLPGPLSVLGSYFSAEAHVMRFKSAVATFGADGLAVPVVKTTPLLAILTSIGTALQTINTAMGTITTASPGATAAAAAQTNVSAAVSLIASAITTIPSACLYVNA